MEIWSNPSCSKSRTAVKALTDAGAEFTERRYLDQSPTAGELEDVLVRLGLEPWEIARTGEAIAKEIDLKSIPKDEANRHRWVEAMVEHPRLIQRPIVLLDDGTAVVARDDETVARVVGSA